MANQLDEMNPQIMEEGRDVHVIAKVVPVTTTATERMIPTVLMLVGAVLMAGGVFYENYIAAGIGALIAVFPWWQMQKISSSFNMMEQRIQTAASMKLIIIWNSVL